MSAFPHGHITPGHVQAFQALRSPFYDNITLTSCFINGEPGVAIVMVEDCGENTMGVMPLFVSITPGMELSFPGEEGAGGKRRSRRRPRREFAAAKAALTPAPK